MPPVTPLPDSAPDLDPVSSASDSPAGESLAEAIRARGGRRRDPAGLVGWAVSAGLHLLAVAVAFLVTWTVVRWVETPRAPVTADFDAAIFEPLASLEDLEPTQEEDAVLAAAPPRLDSIAEALELPEVGPLDLLSGTGRSADFSAALGGPSVESATFAGLQATNARTIVYVVDASGSMIGSFRTVLDELARSLDALVPAQSFAIIFFQRNLAIDVPPPGRLVPVSRRSTSNAIAWARREVIPAGRSNPVEALRQALALKPDCVFLLSSNITGAGQFEIDRSRLLSELDRMNPLDSGTGRRRSQIQCIQFLDPDPLDTMREIARRHSGEEGYRFLDRDELGLAAMEEPLPPEDENSDDDAADGTDGTDGERSEAPTP